MKHQVTLFPKANTIHGTDDEKSISGDNADRHAHSAIVISHTEMRHCSLWFLDTHTHAAK